MISEELQRIKEAKDALKVAISNKGVEVTDADSISVYASKVDLIVTGETTKMQSLEVLNTGEYINTEMPYSSVTVSDKYFYKKYTDGEGNTYIINENGDKIITVGSGTPKPETDEYYHLTIYIPSDNEYSAISSTELLKSEVSEAYFDDEEYGTKIVDGNQCFFLDKKEIQKDTYHTIKLKLVNPNAISGQYSQFTLFYSNGGSSFYLDGELILPEGLTTLKKYFYNGYGLTRLVLPTTLRIIENNALGSFSKLTEIVIPNSVTSIGNEAFKQCSGLTSVTIGSGVTTIGYSVFQFCSNITSIIYNGTKAQFTSITKGDYWKSSIPTSCIVHCTDGNYPITDFD